MPRWCERPLVPSKKGKTPTQTALAKKTKAVFYVKTNLYRY